jgi:hypothetical protein
LPSFLAFPHSLGIALSSIFLSRFKHSAHLISEPLGEKRVEHLEAITVGGGPRISSLVVFFGLGGWAYMGGRVPGNREKRTGGNREGRREKQGIKQASNEIEEKKQKGLAGGFSSSIFGRFLELVLVTVAGRQAESVVLDQWHTTEIVALR